MSREGNIRRTAAALYVSQPSVSQDIRRLERELGIQLFVRDSHGMTLTPAGEGLRRDVEEVLMLLDGAIDRVKAAGQVGRRRVVIAFSPSLGHRLIPSLIPALERQFPNILVDEREVDTGAVNRGVRLGLSHVGIGHCLETEEGLRIERIGFEFLSVALARDHPLSQRGTQVQLAEIDNLPLMLWPRELAPKYHDTLIGICRQSGFEPQIVEGPRRTIIRSYEVSEGKVCCLLPRSTSNLTVPGVGFVEVSDDHAQISIDAVRRDRQEFDAMEVVWRTLVEGGWRL